MPALPIEPHPLPCPSDLDRPLLEPVPNVGKTRAGAALRSWVWKAAGRTPARLHAGRLDVGAPAPSRAGLAAVLPERAVLGIIDHMPGSRSVLIVFTDRTALAGRLGPTGGLEVLPIVLKLRNSIEMSGRKHPVTLRFAQASDGEGLVLAADEASGEPFAILGGARAAEDRGETGGRQHPVAALTWALRMEAIGWASRISRFPAIADPGTGPREGRFGLDIPAPTPDLHGRPYVWPAFLPWRNFDAAGQDRARYLIDLAFRHFSRSMPDGCTRLELTARTPVPRQDGSIAPKPEFVLRPIGGRGQHAPGLVSRLQDGFSAYLDHPDLRKEVLPLKGAAAAQLDEDRGTREILCGIELFCGSSDRAASSHALIQAVKLFGPIHA